MLHSDQPTTFYHYQPKCLRWISDVFLNRRIWLSNPATFNDIWDCQPAFASVDAYSPREIEQLRRRYRAELSLLVGGREARRITSSVAFLQTELPKFLHDLERNYTEAINKEWRSYCLTTTNTNPLMWAHYASQHQGFCLGFRADNSLFGQAQPVVYSDLPPLVKVGEENQVAAQKAFLTKSKQWKYEQEFRLLLQRARNLPPLRGHIRPVDIYIVDDDGYVFFPACAFVSLTFGHSCPSNVRDHIVAIARQIGWRGEFLEVKKASGAYTLAIENYAT